MIAKAIKLLKRTEIASLLLCFAAEGMEVPQDSHGSPSHDSRIPGAMKVLHGEQSTVEIIHRTVYLVAGAWGTLKVIGSLKEGRLVLQPFESVLNGGSEVLASPPFQQASEPLGKFDFVFTVIDMPQLLPQGLPLFRLGAAEVTDFEHLMEETQYPHDARKTVLPGLSGRIPTIEGHGFRFVVR